MDACNNHLWMPKNVKEFNYSEFRKGLEYIGFQKKLICTECCRGTKVSLAQNPKCEIKNCCQKQNIDICFECQNFPCDFIAKNENILKKAKEYQKLGVKKWLEEQIRKAEAGYEGHTGKYYKLIINKNMTAK